MEALGRSLRALSRSAETRPQSGPLGLDLPTDGVPEGQLELKLDRSDGPAEIQAAMRALCDPDERAHLWRVRPRIERLLGLIVHRYRGRKARYRGARKATLQAAWTAVLVNLHPIGAALRGQGA